MKSADDLVIGRLGSTRVAFSEIHSEYKTTSYAKNLFEPRLFKTLLDFGVIKKYYDDLCYAAGLVEELNLNTRIWN
jgi:hypothetical protein